MKDLCLLMFFSAAVSAAELPINSATTGQGSCNVKSVEEVMQEPPCGNDPVCAANKKAELDQVLAAHRCEMERLMPIPAAQPTMSGLVTQ